jgi:hypothetical protein
MLTAYFFGGSTTEVALVIAGVDGSELSGIEVANWLRVKLTKSKAPPRYTTIIIPEMFPSQATIARSWRIMHNFEKKQTIKPVG